MQVNGTIDTAIIIRYPVQYGNLPFRGYEVI